MAKTDTSDAAAPQPPARNPPPGTTIAVTAGEQRQVVIDHTNDSPEPAAYFLRVEGNPVASWVKDAGPEFAVPIVANDWDALPLTLHPPADTPANDYEFQVKVMADGYPTGKAPTPLILRVAASPSSATRDRASSSPADALKTNGVAAPASARGVSSPAGVSLPAGVSPPIADSEENTPPMKEDKAEETDGFVNFQPGTTLEAAGDMEATRAPLVENEFCDVDPQNGHVIKIRAGEIRLLRFNRVNPSSTEPRDCSIEDYGFEKLGGEWSKRTRETDTVSGKMTAVVELTIKPPANAQAKEYPFTVIVGFGGVTNETLSMTLIVLPTPAVSLTTETPRLIGGPLSRYLEFTLKARSIGNCDTAFRVVVKPPPASADAEEGETLFREQAEDPEWRFWFKKELDTARIAVRNGKNAEPVEVKMRAQWMGGLRLRRVNPYSLRVEAVPVTAPDNSGKPDNFVDLTVGRDPLRTMTAISLISLLLLLMVWLGRGPSDIEPEKYAAQGSDEAYWVVAPPVKSSADANKLAEVNNNVDTTISWDAPWLSCLNLNISGGGQNDTFRRWGSGSYPVHMPVPNRSQFEERAYQVSRRIGGAEQKALVRFVASSPLTPLIISGVTGVKTTSEGYEATLEIPRGGKTRFALQNGAATELALTYWIIKSPNWDNSFFAFDRQVHNATPGKGQEAAYTVSGKPDGKDDGDQNLELITTDANKPRVTIHLKLVEKGSP